MLNTNRANVPEFYCYSTGAVCCALTMYCNTYQYCQDTYQNSNLNLIEAEHAFKLLEFNKQNPFLTDFEILALPILIMIKGLSQGVEHWKTLQQHQTSIYFLVNWWLRGNKPPPRCQALVNGALCLEESNSPQTSPYCDVLHSCKATSVKPCANERHSVAVLFCDNHRCLFGHQESNKDKNKKPCKLERFHSGDFCAKHVCVGCLLNNSNPIKPRTPNACEDHKCNEINCNQLQIFPHRFCVKHVCTECASSGTNTKLPRTGENSSFCVYHKCTVPKCNVKRFNENTEFCSYHVCRVCNEQKHLAGVDMLCPQAQLCVGHRCSLSSSCLNAKTNASLFCVRHSCKECIAQKCANINPAVYKPPHNSCENHPLCDFVSNSGKLCHTIAKKPDVYCAKHQDGNSKHKAKGEVSYNKPCCAKNAKGKNCKAKPPTFKNNNYWYCNVHSPIIESSDSSEEEEEYENDSDIDNKKLDQKVLEPVLRSRSGSVIKFKQICCTGLKGEQPCGILAYFENGNAVWLCPIHEKRQVEIITKETDPILEPKKKVEPKSNEQPVKSINTSNENKSEKTSIAADKNKKTSAEKNVDSCNKANTEQVQTQQSKLKKDILLKHPFIPYQKTYHVFCFKFQIIMRIIRKTNK